MTKHYYGTKRLAAELMTRAEYNDFRGWKLPSDENGEDDGYLVEYHDGGKPNVVGRAGYVSWSPKEQFEAAYQPIDALSFGHALAALKEGHSVWRSGWADEIKLVLMPDRSEEWDTGTVYIVFTDATFFKWGPCCDDLTANDWQIV